jgi:hypothetical protein
MTRSMSSKIERNATIRIPFKVGIDEKGPCIGYCPFHAHPQIVGNGELVKCLERYCRYLSIFRPDGSDIKEGILLQVFITPNKDAYKTKEKKKSLEDGLRFAGEYFRRAINEYVQSLVEEKKPLYDVRVEKICPKEHPYLEGCPLCEYPKPKKEKQKISRKTKKKNQELK